MDTDFQQLKNSVIEGRKAFRQSEAAKILDSHKKDGSYSAEERKQILDEAHRCLSDMESFLRTDYPSLTDDDIDLCLLSALQCKAKTCSDCLTVSEEAIRVRKHRLKGKLPREAMSLVWEERSGTRLLKTLFMKDTMQNVWRRFPLTVVYLLLLTVGCILFVWEKIPDKWNSITLAILFNLFLGLILTSTTTLWGEEVKKKSLRLWVTVVGNLLLVLNAVFVSKHINNEPSAAFFITQASITTALAVAFFHLPFFREKDDLPLWNFTWRTFLWFCISFLTGGILAGGLILLMNSLETLFGIKVEDPWYFTIGILSMLTVPVLLFLARIPEGEDKRSDVAVISKFLLFVIRYLFVPLLILYLIVLYVYGLRILVRWELPNGGVAWLVSALMIGCVIVELCLYPLMRSEGVGESEKLSLSSDSRQRKSKGQAGNPSGEGKPFEKWIVRWLPVLILPLLMLMTIGTARRLSDYGVTPPRLYLLMFNLWCYAVCLGLFFGRAKRIRWIMTSFAAVFFLTSVLPVNLTTVSVGIRKKAFCKMVENSLPATLPMSDSSAKEWLNTIEEEDVRRKIQEELDFFKRTDKDALSDIMSEKAVRTLAKASYYHRSGTEESKSQYEVISPNWDKSRPVSIPEGYRKMWSHFVQFNQSERIKDGRLHIKDLPGDASDAHISVDLETLKTIQPTDDYPMFYSADSSYVFVVNHFYIEFDSDSTLYYTSILSGYVFGK
ncbi:MAG: DUF4153 domain-containing protein [Bacteroidaceae bacterium]|nr:DUF4153 domain-containing protein [Bacteroidaceae bacterium]